MIRISGPKSSPNKLTRKVSYPKQFPNEIMQFSSLWPTCYFVEFYMFKSLNLIQILNIQPCFMEVTKDIFLSKNFLQGNLPTTTKLWYKQLGGVRGAILYNRVQSVLNCLNLKWQVVEHVG